MMQPKNDFDNKSNDNADINVEITTPPPLPHFYSYAILCRYLLIVANMNVNISQKS